ncbi:MAG: hypothetical protein ABH886_00165 [Candidatus Desantisbacteria bacterium]
MYSVDDVPLPERNHMKNDESEPSQKLGNWGIAELGSMQLIVTDGVRNA